MCVHVNGGAHRGQETSDPLELELKMWCATQCGYSELKSSTGQQMPLNPELSLQPGFSAGLEFIPTQGWRHFMCISWAYHKHTDFLLYFCQGLTRSFSLFHLSLKNLQRTLWILSTATFELEFCEMVLFEVRIHMTSRLLIW